MKFFITVLVALFLTGCGTLFQKPQERVVYKYIPVPKETTRTVALAAPYDPDYYSVQPWPVKEQLLMDLIQKHTTSVGVCNARLKGVDLWSDQQSLFFESLNKQ